MREHPIPQDITGYRFHIIGSMTLKQFLEVAAGCVVALIFYQTNLFEPIKWAFIFVSIGLGVVAAFLPIEERPLDHWIITFFKVLYKPTQFYWRREPQIPKAFLYTQSQDVRDQEPELDLSTVRRERIREYLRSLRTQGLVDNDYSQDEVSRIGSILEAFQTQPIVSSSEVRVKPQKPKLTVRVRQLGGDGFKNPLAETVVFGGRQMGNAPQTKTPNLQGQDLQKERQTKRGAVLQTQQVAQNIQVPETKSVVVENAQSIEEQNGNARGFDETQGDDRTYLKSDGARKQTETFGGVEFNPDLPFPSTPTEPNRIVGMVLSSEGNLLENAVVEIIDENEEVARAVVTNALGQFFTTTPLKNGQYKVVVEKDGFEFQPKQITLTGEVVVPLELKGAVALA